MESNWNSGLPWLQGNEQDFPLGAKATSYLLPAAADAAELRHDTFELPGWMESRENLGLSGVDLFDDVNFESLSDVKLETDDHLSYEFINETNGINDMEEDYSLTIKPEDMLVPLSELQPEKYASTPQGLGPNTLAAASVSPSMTIPKVSIRVNRIQVPVNRHETQNVGIAFMEASPATNSIPLENSGYHIIQPQNFNNTVYENEQNYNVEELINELVDMANTEPNGLKNLISSFDASLVQAGMDDLLSQLESCDAKAVLPEVPQWSVDPASPASVPSPVPSVGSLSPQSAADQAFHHLTTTYTIDDATVQSDKDSSFSSVMSPLSEGSVSVSSPSFIDDDDEDSDMEYSKPEMHSYSRSPSKRKTTRKPGRGSSFPEGRKERKKEQNKQAALRYRQKKKQEDDVLMAKIEEEEERQKKLKAKYSNLKQELSCLKKLMREVLIAKGTLSPTAFKKKK